MGSTIRRVAGRAFLQSGREAIQKRFRGPDGCTNLQLGCMTPNGSETVIHDLTLHMELNQTHTVLHADVSNAFKLPAPLRLPQGGAHALPGGLLAGHAVLPPRV